MNRMRCMAHLSGAELALPPWPCHGVTSISTRDHSPAPGNGSAQRISKPPQFLFCTASACRLCRGFAFWSGQPRRGPQRTGARGPRPQGIYRETPGSGPQGQDVRAPGAARRPPPPHCTRRLALWSRRHEHHVAIHAPDRALRLQRPTTIYITSRDRDEFGSSSELAMFAGVVESSSLKQLSHRAAPPLNPQQQCHEAEPRARGPLVHSRGGGQPAAHRATKGARARCVGLAPCPAYSSGPRKGVTGLQSASALRWCSCSPGGCGPPRRGSAPCWRVVLPTDALLASPFAPLPCHPSLPGF